MINQEQLQRIHSLYQEGRFQCNFYRKKLADARFKNYEDFSRIPFSRKEEVRESSVYDRTATPTENIFGIYSSSGTTGEKKYYVYNRHDKKIQEECARIFMNMAGIDEKDLGGILSPIGTSVMGHCMTWQFSAVGAGVVHCPEPSPENIVKTLDKFPVTAIATLPQVAASVIENPEHAKAAGNSTVKSLLLGGDHLSETVRKQLENTWEADVYNLFGMSEIFGPIAGECAMKNGLHFPTRYLAIEILDPKTRKSVTLGETGVAVYTTLWDKGFPLLRYWSDDLISIDDTPCPCGSPMPRLFFRGRTE